MAKIPLRAYNREIESLIDQGQTLEAVAHCQYILKTFPKCLDTYRLLGKTYLELQRFTEAGDVFNRLLLAVPEDFIANLGMSIIYDDQKNLDAAIWHMERAFETQSSNPAIQGELRRLYSRRDGMEPPKIRLTRGALAQMYARGDQYPQAISEIRSVLAEEPTRMDLLVLLARVYFRAGQKVEATEICTNLLKKYPYCLDANRILVEILPGTTRAENLQVYRHRVNALDPYSAFAAPSIFNSADVADAAVTIEKLTYQADAWAPAKFGLEPPKQEATPDWLTNQTAAPAEAPIEPTSEENIPEWMKVAGWSATTAAVVEATERDSAGQTLEPEAAAVAAAEDLSSGEVPDWLKSMAPPGALEQPAVEPAMDATVSEEDINWLEGLGAPPATAQKGKDDTLVRPISSEGISTLGALGAAAVAGAAAAGAKKEEKLPEVPAQPAEETPDWLGDLGTTPTETTPATFAPETQPDEALPDWLAGMGAGAAAEQTFPPQAEGMDSNLPDWLKNADTGFAGQSMPVAETPIEITSAQPVMGDNGLPVSDEDAFAWLESLAAKQGANPEELLTNPDERPTETPDWLKQLSEPEKPAQPGIGMGAAAGATVAAASLFGGEKPTETAATPPTEELFGDVIPPASANEAAPTGVMSDDDAFSWLESLAAKQGAKPEELLTKPEERAESAPEWALQMGRESVQPETPTLEPALNETPGDLSWLQSIGNEPPVDESTIGEVPLEEAIFAKVAADSIFEDKLSSETPVVESASADEVAEWLHQLDAEDSAISPLPTAAVEQPSVYATEELPDWLKEEEPAELPSEELPDWLKGEAAEQAPVVSAPQAGWESEQPPVEVVPILASEEPVREVDVAPIRAVPSLEKLMPELAPAKPAKGASASAEKDKALFESAQTELQRNNLSEAMQGFSKLIKRGKMLDEIIFNLREALYRHPVDVVIWQTLGDAYMRAQRLQEALDAYTKAEELLR